MEKNQGIDRAYVLAAFVGLLIRGKPTAKFVRKYRLSRQEQSRVARYAMMTIMTSSVRVSRYSPVAYVRRLARRFSIPEIEIRHMARSVIRGCLTDSGWRQQGEDRLKAIGLVVDGFLSRDKTLVAGDPFGFVAAADYLANEVLRPSVAAQSGWDIVGNLVHAILDGEPENLPDDIKGLIEDAGLERT